jgi:hypothetical protein
MDILLPDKILDLLMIATTFSIILMSLIQKIKTFNVIKSNGHIMLANLSLSFLGILFGKCFYDLDVIDGLWVSLFSFIGAPSIYQLLKKQNIINYTPKSLDECRGCVVINQENIINR